MKEIGAIDAFLGISQSRHRAAHASMRVAHGDRMVARERRFEYILHANKKKS
jgi:hypothetical protein